MKRLFCGAIASLLGCASTTAGDVIVVEVGESIQAALDAAGPDDIVELAPGTHAINAPLNVSDVTLRGANSIDDVDDSVIDAQRLSRHMTLRGSSTVESIHFTNGMTGWLGYEPVPDSKARGWYGDPDGDPRDWIPSSESPFGFGYDAYGGSITVIVPCGDETGASTVDGCRFTGCRALLGGVIHQFGASCVCGSASTLLDAPASFLGCEFVNNSARFAAVAFTDCQYLEFNQCSMHQNAAPELFRAFWVPNRVDLTGCLICLDDAGGLESAGLRITTDIDTCIAYACHDEDQDGRIDACTGQTNIVQVLIDEAAAAGETTVRLPAGRFQLRQPLKIESDMTIQGASAGGTTLDGRDSIPIASVAGIDCTFENLTITSGRNGRGGGFYGVFGRFDFQAVTFTECNADSGAAVEGSNYGEVRLTDCDVNHCSSRQSIVRYTSGGLMEDTTFHDNQLLAENASLVGINPFAPFPNVIVTDSMFRMSDAAFTTTCFTLEGQVQVTVDRCTFDLRASPLARAAISDGDSLQAIDSVFLYEGDRRVIFENTLIYATRCEFGGCCPSDLFHRLAEETWPSAYMCPGCEGDYSCDGEIDSGDLGRFLSQWGTDEPRHDYDGDGIVRSSDLGRLLSNWGTCR